MNDRPKARANKPGIIFMIFNFIFVENCLSYNVIHDFSVWLGTGSNPADVNRFRSHTVKYSTWDNSTSLSSTFKDLK